MTAIGHLRDRVTVLNATTTADGKGGQVTTWPPEGESCWAAIRTLSGREALQLGTLRETVPVRITLRYRTDVTVQSRLRRDADGQVFELSSVRDPDGRRRWLECDAMEVA